MLGADKELFVSVKINYKMPSIVKTALTQFAEDKEEGVLSRLFEQAFIDFINSNDIPVLNIENTNIQFKEDIRNFILADDIVFNEVKVLLRLLRYASIDEAYNNLETIEPLIRDLLNSVYSKVGMNMRKNIIKALMFSIKETLNCVFEVLSEKMIIDCIEKKKLNLIDSLNDN